MKDSKYWQQRAANRENKANISAEVLLKRLKKEYAKAMAEIEKTISVFYAKYADQNNVSYADAVKYLNSKDRKEFQATLQDFIKMVEGNIDGRFTQQIKNISSRVRITGLQALLTAIQAQLEVLFDKKDIGYQPQAYNLLSNVYTDSYYNTLYDIGQGVGFTQSFSQLNNNAIKEAIEYPWSGQSFSERIWNNKQKLIVNLRSTITQGIIQGHGVDTMTQNISKRMDVSYMDAERLIRTETNYVLNAGTKTGYADFGVTQYEFLATLDSRTSEECRYQDGKKYNIDEARPGVNYPPLHIRCRSTTVPYFPEDQASEYERIAKNPDEKKYYKVPADMDYPTWYNKYVIDSKESIIKRILDNPKRLEIYSIQKYRKHLLGTKQYEDYKKSNLARGRPEQSRIFISKEEATELIKKYAGTGEFRWTRKGKWDRVEYVSHNKIIGDYVDKKGNRVDTKRFCIHYGDNNTHIVPVQEM